MKDSPRVIWYDNWLGSEVVESMNVLTKSLLFVFADAGYNNLGNSCSPQSMVVILGEGGGKGTSVDAKGNLLFFHRHQDGANSTILFAL